MSYWQITNRGFLPSTDPLTTLLTSMNELDWLGKSLPGFMERRIVREELVARLRHLKFNVVEMVQTPNFFTEAQLERLFMLYSYFGSAYIHATYENPSSRIPKEIALPLCSIAQRLDRIPILSYSSYCLSNWERIDPKRPIEIENLRLSQQFQGGDGHKDESWFILIHTDIEAKAGPAIAGMSTLLSEQRNFGLIKEVLDTMGNCMSKVNKTMDRMTENCSPEIYFNRVRPYIFGFQNVNYEGTDMGLVSFRGETGAQSSIIPAMQSVLGIMHKQSMLTDHLTDMRNYMPAPHRKFLESLEENFASKNHITIRESVLNNPSLHETYNECLNQFIKFRKTHLQYAVDYIEKKVDDPTGTGGTPYIKWLSELIKESEEYLIK